MKTILSILLLAVSVVAVQAQSIATNYFWTYGNTNQLMTLKIGPKEFPMTPAMSNSIWFATKSLNQFYGFTGTNRLDDRDMAGFALWWHAENQWIPMFNASLEAQAAVQRIKPDLKALSFQKLSNIYWIMYEEVLVEP